MSREATILVFSTQLVLERVEKLVTLSPMALLPSPYPTALGLIGPSKKQVLMTSARSDQS
jgi:hypothetical protein